MEIREDRPSYVVFERQPVEDRDRSLAEGRYMTKDVDFAIITPIGSKDRIPREVSSWLSNMEQQVREERMPRQWYQQYKDAYEAWKRGEEVPLNGTPIKGWSLIGPAQQKNILGANVRTVEDLAQANDEALLRIGMGAVELKMQAQTWLKTAKDVGSVVKSNTVLEARITTLERDNKSLRTQNDELRSENALLVARLPKETVGA